MRYLVTGGCGFIGSHIAEALVADGDDVRVYDNLSSGHEHNLAAFRDGVEFVQADVRDPDALATAMQDVHCVFHEAALVSVFDSVERPRDNHDINLTGTLNVLLAAKEAGVRRVLLAGTAAVYGNDPQLPKREDMPLSPESPYAVAKAGGELYLQMFARLYGLETVILRYFNVYGPRQDPGSMYSGVISRFADVAVAGQQPVIFGDGLQTRDFVFVRDVVQANLLAARSTRVGHGEVFNVGTGRQTSLLAVLDALRAAGAPVAEPRLEPVRQGDIRHSVASIDHARELLGYTPKFDVEAGMRELLPSLRAESNGTGTR